MRNLILFLALTLTGAAGAQECVTPPQTCQVCVLSTGTVGISSCGQSAPQECPSFPSSLLTQAPDVEPGSLQELLAARLWTLWSPGNAAYDVLTDHRRNFVRDSLLAGVEEHGDVTGRGDVWIDYAENEVRLLAAECLGHMVVRQIPDGTGGTALAVLPRSTATRGRCTGALNSWLPRQLGAFTEAELRPYAEARAFSMSAKSEARDEFLVGLAAQFRELSPEDRREVLDHAALMGPDPEGGRK